MWQWPSCSSASVSSASSSSSASTPIGWCPLTSMILGWRLSSRTPSSSRKFRGGGRNSSKWWPKYSNLKLRTKCLRNSLQLPLNLSSRKGKTRKSRWKTKKKGLKVDQKKIWKLRNRLWTVMKELISTKLMNSKGERYINGINKYLSFLATEWNDICNFFLSTKT